MRYFTLTIFSALAYFAFRQTWWVGCIFVALLFYALWSANAHRYLIYLLVGAAALFVLFTSPQALGHDIDLYALDRSFRFGSGERVQAAQILQALLGCLVVIWGGTIVFKDLHKKGNGK